MKKSVYGCANSLLTLAAHEEAALAGLIRVVEDGHTIVFVQDILVRPQFQRRGIGPALFAGSPFHDKTKPVSGFLAYDGGPQGFLRAAVNTNEKRNHEICFIIVSSRRFCVSI